MTMEEPVVSQLQTILAKLLPLIQYMIRDKPFKIFFLFLHLTNENNIYLSITMQYWKKILCFESKDKNQQKRLKPYIL